LETAWDTIRARFAKSKLQAGRHLNTMNDSHLERGITGLETAIIMIAFVVVASVFAFTVLSTGIFSSERSKETIFQGLAQAQTSIRTSGSVIAFTGQVGSTDTVFKFSVIVENSTGGEPIDLTPPYTANDTGTDPDSSSTTNTTVVTYIDSNQSVSDVPWSVNIFGPSTDTLLDPGEKAEITVWLLQRETGTALGDDDSASYFASAGGFTSSNTLLAAGDSFTLQIQPATGSVLIVQRTLPPVLDTVMNLR
jgi:flagellin FlaB